MRSQTRSKVLDKEEADIDMRFLLANERTLLAWIRTSLALQAAGVAIMHFDGSNHRIYGVLILAIGATAAAVGYWRFREADKAIREFRLAKKGLGPLLITLAVLVIAVGALVVYL
jgi:putative membrane protein